MEELEERILQVSDTKSQSPALLLLSLPILTFSVPHQPSTQSYNFNIGYSLSTKQNFNPLHYFQQW